MPKVSKTKRARQNHWAKYLKDRRERHKVGHDDNHSGENYDQKSEHRFDSVDPIAKKEIGRSALVEIRQNSENVSPVSRKQHERHDHTIDPMEGCSNTAKPILRKVLERSKFVEIHDNSENVVQNLVSVEPSEGCSVTADPVSR
ncbi:hypothetical protein O0L34_g11911 [Tuta absoluta]|nr:hypothetical protein O0L34_g11911 [Tuta absoluta]